MYKTKLLLITYALINLTIKLPLSYSAVCDPEPRPTTQTLIFYAKLIRLTYMPWLLCHGFADE